MIRIGNWGRRRRLDDLIASWVRYRDMIAQNAGRDTVTPEQEQEFLKLKANISQHLPLLVELAGHGSLNVEVQGRTKEIMELMNRHLTLAGTPAAADTNGDEFMSRWHANFLYLNRFKGLKEPAMARPVAAPGSIPGASPLSAVRRLFAFIFDNWLMRLVVRVAVLAVIVIGGARLLNIDLRQVPEWGRNIYQEWWGGAKENAAPTTAAATHAPGGAAPARPRAGTTPTTGGTIVQPMPQPVSRDRTIHLGQRPKDAPRYSVDGSGPFVAPKAGNPFRWAIQKISPLVPLPVKQFFQPVVQQWGVEATVAMVGLGLLLLGYMLFGRAR